MLQQALQKIQSELSEKAKDKYVQAIGAFLIKHIRQRTEHAPFILTDGKTIAGSLGAMKEEARKQQSNGVGMLTDDEAFAIVLKYFGVPVADPVPAAVPVVPDINVTLDDVLF